jgi:hypothetical protein
MNKPIWKPVAVFIFSVLILVAVGWFFKSSTKNTPEPITDTPTVTPNTSAVESTSTSDLYTDWNTYTNTSYGLSFKYPQDFKVEERVPGFIVITTLTENVPQAGISIDARQQGSYQSLTSAQENINIIYTVSTTGEINGWTTFDVIGKEGMLKDLKFKMALAPYKAGVIEMETIDAEPYRNIFEQVLSTFEFSN